MESDPSVDSWRGHCLNYFARGEAVVAKTLETAQASGHIMTIKHLAGQRLVDLIALSNRICGTNKQVSALTSALQMWQDVEAKRQFLAHGVVTVATDAQGKWVALLDVRVFRSSIAKADRLTLKQSEAEEFAKELANAFKSLSGQLGQFRKRLKSG